MWGKEAKFSMVVRLTLAHPTTSRPIGQHSPNALLQEICFYVRHCGVPCFIGIKFSQQSQLHMCHPNHNWKKLLTSCIDMVIFGLRTGAITDCKNSVYQTDTGVEHTIVYLYTVVCCNT